MPDRGGSNTKHEGAKGPTTGKLYYGQRAGLDAPQLEYAKMRALIAAKYEALEDGGWFQEWFGYYCVDSHDVPGKAGSDPNGFLHTKLWIADLWPLRAKVSTLDETALFSVVELLHDCVSKPIEGWHHDFGGCGMHWSTFDGAAGQGRWRDEVNGVLQFYGEGFELSTDGEVQRRGAEGVRELLAQSAPSNAPRGDRDKVTEAVRAFRHFSATREQRINAVRNLADVLEFYRQQIKTSELKRDEGDLFNIANNFGIRHHNERQKDEYSDGFIDWLFHVYLASVHLVLRLVHGADEPAPPPLPIVPEPTEGYRDEDYGGSDIPF